MLRFVQAMVAEDGWLLESVLPFVTSNPARLLKMLGKGRLAVGADADILLLRVWRTGRLKDGEVGGDGWRVGGR